MEQEQSQESKETENEQLDEPDEFQEVKEVQKKRRSTDTSIRKLQHIDLESVNIKEVFQKDLLQANNETNRMVAATKANIANVVNFCNKDKPGEPLIEKINKERRNSRIDTEKLIKKSIYEVKRKAKTDLQVIQLYDKSLTNEIQNHIKRDVIDKGLTSIKEKTKTDFQNTNENTAILVTETKSTVENFITTISENVAKDEDNASANELWQKLKQKAQKDFKTSNEKAQKLSDRTRYQMQENMNIFFTNPTGSKSIEELQSEQFVKENLMEVSEKIKSDILREKTNFSHTVEETKDNVGLNLLFPKNADEDLETNKNTLLSFCDKTKNDFKEVNSKVQDGVTSLKQQIPTEFHTIPPNKTEDFPEILNRFPETAQTDFKNTNKKISEDVKDLKQKITQSISLKDDPREQSSKKQGEVSKVIEQSLNEFQGMAKNDFQETNEKVMENVVVAKAKIDESVDKLKGHLFFKRI